MTTREPHLVRTASTLPQFFQSVAYTCIISSSLAATLLSIWKVFYYLTRTPIFAYLHQLYAQERYLKSLQAREGITQTFLKRYSALLSILGSYYGSDRLGLGIARDEGEKGTPLLLDSLSHSLEGLSRVVHDLPGATPIASTSPSTILSEDVHDLSHSLSKGINKSKSEIMPAGRSTADNLPSHVESAIDLRTEIRSLKGLLLSRRNLAQSQ
ncbi:hypothetical protein E3P81_01408 [Wallemia ichthyophaga]|nr:hypothetical protein E3P97_01409 [Wallemia ichthyophaga]TIB05590.1 hypothetical protein E3P96_01118 [Wallemia ichthyophaga]TIB33978.1 hypothetical protein E3P85_01058 [Wallemia ichthyophaga]TIB48234.1 hypothetical protein E3P82_01407 [Wallemia ichthyophaga]TIB52409.1 hypothetical protein E3P81_01408 [Wallemia ichthyophaga]